MGGPGKTIELTREQIIQILEEKARERLGISAHELLIRYRQGKIENPGELADILMTADLLPEDDEIFKAA